MAKTPENQPQPLIIRSKQQMRNWSRSMKQKSEHKTLALVPTMGSLYNGHISLINEAKKHSQLIVVSIYINPGQFSTNEDISTYPNDFKSDYDKLVAVGGVDVVFNPVNLYDYGVNGGGNKKKKEGGGEGVSVVSCVEEGVSGSGSGHESWIRVEKLEKGLCGKSRPLFFRGVATVVAKLFNVVEPDFAVFGKKDYQQWRIVERMVRDLDFVVEIIGAEIMRDEDGLAMSSRNVYLSPEERQKALSINQSLSKAKQAVEKGVINCKELRESVIMAIEDAGGKVDYAEIVDQHTLEAAEDVKSPVVFCIAASFGKARLLDNIEIDV